MRWTAHDDRGRRYRGTAVAGGSGLGIARRDLTFVPALGDDASTLTVTFPVGIDGRPRQVTLNLPG